MSLKKILNSSSQPTTIMEMMEEVKNSANKLKQTLQEIKEWEKSIIIKSNNEKRSI